MTELQKSPLVDLKGFLLRYETFKGRSGWKKRWAVLFDFCLYLYKDQSSKECFFALLLPGSNVTQSHDDSGQYRSSIKVEEPNQQPVFLSTETPLDFRMWFDALSSASQQRKLTAVPGGGIRDEQTLMRQQAMNDSRQQFNQQSQQRTVVTTTTTTSGFDTSNEQNSQKYQNESRSSYNAVGIGRVPSDVSATDGIAVYDSQRGAGLRFNTTGSAGVGGSANGSVQQRGDTRIERTFVEHHQQQQQFFGEDQHQQRQQQQQQQRSDQMLVRAEPVRSAPPPLSMQSAGSNSSAMSGRYEVRTETTQRQQRSGGGGGGYATASNFGLNRRPIETVREDPQMDDSEVIATAPLDEIKRKYPVSGLAKRMSIAASDLLGKSHDELLLLLIQLNREKAALERRRDYYLALLNKQPNMRDAERMKADLREIDNQIELHDPLITFIGNIISMGALYSGDDVMFASEYRQHLLQPGEVKPVKENVGFIRRQQERQVARQFSDHPDRADGVQIPGSVESQEFRVTRHQLESELRELESVYADHRRRKGDLAAFMTDLGHRVASGRLNGGVGHQQVMTGTYLETDLDTGLSVDLSAKFPQRRTAVGGVGVGGASTTTASMTTASSSAGRGAALNGSGRIGGYEVERRAANSVSDDVFQQQRTSFKSATAGGVGGGGHVNFGGGAMTTTKTVVTTVDSGDRYGRIPDADEFARQRRGNTITGGGAGATVSSSNRAFVSGVSGLPSALPAPEVYVSQPQLYRADHAGSGASNSISVQERLNLALGLDTTDNKTVVISNNNSSMSRSPGNQTVLSASSSTKKPLVSSDANRYNRTTTFTRTETVGGLDHRNQGEFIEDMRGLERGAYYRVE